MWMVWSPIGDGWEEPPRQRKRQDAVEDAGGEGHYWDKVGPETQLHF